METDKSFELCAVRERSEPGGDLVFLKIETSAPVAAPGQFAMLRGPWGDAPLLPRAISYCDAGPGWALFLFRVQGEGTRRLAGLSVGDRLSVAGPLGNAFPRAANPWLIAGGVGLPPLWFYSKRFGGRLFWGVPSLFASAGLAQPDWQVASDDGTLGFHGNCVDLFSEALGTEAPDAVFSCGPYPMMAALKTVCAQRELPLLVSLEGKMACGIGVCCGCAHPATAGGYVHVCEKGPIFPAAEVQL
ncbi:dihydroorotate dehydrogenase electron transfer subunit [Myxococcota bacterium]|nr:dihydroorotate dehydrogenase electron transfer subunit [Myxococcota bacterium]MBU1413399.1 dihydroorotate dehydrogenase electron transfer subunit [Myxococcota bacterium]MBU1510110.1 dihydroorotate dehydrogenase electron transfer subunit [Myxococcota bacterium]